MASQTKAPSQILGSELTSLGFLAEKIALCLARFNATYGTSPAHGRLVLDDECCPPLTGRAWRYSSVINNTCTAPEYPCLLVIFLP